MSKTLWGFLLLVSAGCNEPPPAAQTFPDKYGPRNQSLSQLSLGMTKVDVTATVGKPDSIGSTSLAKKLHAPVYELWHYNLSVDGHSKATLLFDSKGELVEIGSFNVNSASKNDVVPFQSSIR
jgi:hypothetical protein